MSQLYFPCPFCAEKGEIMMVSCMTLRSTGTRIRGFHILCDTCQLRGSWSASVPAARAIWNEAVVAYNHRGIASDHEETTAAGREEGISDEGNGAPAGPMSVLPYGRGRQEDPV